MDAAAHFGFCECELSWGSLAWVPQFRPARRIQSAEVRVTCSANHLPKMPWGWGKSSSKESRKGSKDVVDIGQEPRVHSPRVQGLSGRKAGSNGEDGKASRRVPHRFSLDVSQQNSDPRSVFAISSLCSRSPSPSTPSTRCPSFNDKKLPAQPFPLPTPVSRTLSGNILPTGHTGSTRLVHSPSVPLSSSDGLENRHQTFEATEIELGTSNGASCSNSSVSSLGSVDVVDSWNHGASTLSRLRPILDTDASDQACHQNQTLGSSTPKHSRKNSKQDLSRPSSPLPGGQTPSSSPRRVYSDVKRALSPIRVEHAGNRFLQWNGGSAPDSSYSSPARSPRRVSNSEQAAYGGWVRHDGFSGSAQGSSPGSGNNSVHNSSGGDPAQLSWNTASRKSNEPSPVPSPRRSPAPSGTVSPLHPRHSVSPGGVDSPSWHEDGKTSAHKLPLPPRIPSGSPLSSPPISPAPSPSTGRLNSRSDSSLGNTLTRWQRGKLLGSGTFGNVYVGFNSASGALCAMKEVLVSDDSKSKESVKQLGQEISLLSRLRHQNIVQYIGTDTLEDRLCIYLEYVSGGSIHKLLQDYGAFKEPVIRRYTRQILEGLAYLHNMNTVHRDIKGANILVDTNGKVKLADFGMAKHITAHSFPLSFKGSPYWMAPEVIKHTNGYDLAVDIWSLGCTVLEMAMAKPPWSQYEGVAAMFKIGNSKELPPMPDDLSPEGKDFVRLCLQRDPNHRPTAYQLLKHPFVENLFEDDKYDFPEVTANTAFSSQYSEVMATTNFGIQFPAGGYRHDNDGALPPSGVRPRGPLSPTPSDLSPRNLPTGYGLSNPNSSSPTGHSQRHAYNGLSSLPHSPRVQSGASTPRNGAYGSPHGSAHGSLHGNSYTQVHANGNYGAISGPFSDGYANTPRQNGLYGNSSTTNGGGYIEPVKSEFHWGAGTPHRTPEGSPRRWDPPHGSDILGMALGRVSQDSEEDMRKQFSMDGNLGEHVSQQLLGLQFSPMVHHQ